MNLTFDTVPTGLTLYLDGIAKTTPFVYDTLVGFNHTIEARNQTVGRDRPTRSPPGPTAARRRTRSSCPAADQAYTATYTASTAPATPAFVQVNSGDAADAPRATVAVAYPAAQTAGDTNIVAIGWNDTTSTITSVTDSAGNAYQLAAPTDRGAGREPGDLLRQEHPAAAAGANTVTVMFSSGRAVSPTSAITEYSGLDPTNPFDVTASAAGHRRRPPAAGTSRRPSPTS